MTSVDVIPVKSPNDKKLYKHVRLSNGLTVLLISDPEIKKTDDKVCGLLGDQRKAVWVEFCIHPCI